MLEFSPILDEHQDNRDSVHPRRYFNEKAPKEVVEYKMKMLVFYSKPGR